MKPEPNVTNPIQAFDAELNTGMSKECGNSMPRHRLPTQGFARAVFVEMEVIEHDLQRAGELIDLGPKEERRVLRLVNPAMQGKRATTHTLQMSYQMVKPGEIARADVIPSRRSASW